MDKYPKVIICFSEEKENLSQLLIEFPKYFGRTVNQISFQNRDTLLQFLIENHNSKIEVQLIILDLQNSNNDTLAFLDEINHSSPHAIKLIISENIHFATIEQNNEKTKTIQYLAKPWSAEELELAVNVATKCYSWLISLNKKNEEIKELKVELEEKATVRLKNLIDSNLAKDKFISLIAHDLKNPFNALLGISDILLNNWKEITEEEKLDLIKDLYTTSENTYKLLESLLEWTKSQKEKLNASPKNINIQPVINSNIKIAKNNASPKKITIKNEINDEIRVVVDENMISTVFRNLISNAVKYTQPGGKINISASENKDNCTFCVADNGQGIDKPYILELFKPANLKTLTDNRINGNGNGIKNGINGLGLFFCKEFIEQNGGNIWLKTKKGIGSKFYFTVPLAVV